MAQFNRPGAFTRRMGSVGPVVTTGPAPTHEGGSGYARDAKSELFLLAVSLMMQDTFYETSDARLDRFRILVHQVALVDFPWLARFAPYLRTSMFMRTASIVLAAEAVAARLGKVSGDGADQGMVESEHTLRSLVASVLNRADEPGELLAYWQSRYGKAIPKPIKRGIADYLAGEQFSEYAALKYDGDSKNWRLGDVVEMVHPEGTPSRSALFRYLLDRRHNPKDIRADLNLLPMIAERRRLEAIPPSDRRAVLRMEGDSALLRRAGVTWEWLSGWVPGGMDAQAWEAAIPTMGYMALLRNLRNFDKVGISDATAKQVAARLEDPAQVARSMQFPYRFWNAFREVTKAGSVRWGGALDTALNLSCQNIPELPGRSLILIDTSASMRSGLSFTSPVEQAIVFGSALARKNLGRVDVYGWADRSFHFPIRPGGSVLNDITLMNGLVGSVGHGTYIEAGMRHLRAVGKDRHERVFIFSDMQVMDHLVPAVGGGGPWMYGYNLSGYATGALDTRTPGCHEFGGLSDAMFRLIPLLESTSRIADADSWPF